MRLTEVYPTTKIFFILPSNNNFLEKTRKNADISIKSDQQQSAVTTIEGVRNILQNAVNQYNNKNVITINAKDFIPQYQECFYKDNVHHTDLGNILFGNALAGAISHHL